jgi:hypothetical protein
MAAATPFRERVRRLASIAVLTVAWGSIVATSEDPPDDVLWEQMLVPVDRLADRDVRLVVAMNQAAASYQSPDVPLQIEMRIHTQELAPKRFEGAIVLPDGRTVNLRLSEEPYEPILQLKPAWVPPRCDRACISTAQLTLSGLRALPASTMLEFYASVTFDRGKDSAPEGSALAMAVIRDRASLITSNTIGGVFPAEGVLLTTADPETRQSLVLEMDRSAIPGLDPSTSTVNLLWKGGAMQTLPASAETVAAMTFRPAGQAPVAVPVDGSLPVVDGQADARFQVPFRVTCDQEVCSSPLQIEYELREGDWVFIDWSNYIPGMRTEEDDEWVQGWRIRLVPVTG